jgi:apolipoprotein N-acyltransferase
MIEIACALVSGLGFFFSIGLGDQWCLAWLAPVPVLWLAFGQIRPWRVFAAAFAAYAIGGANCLPAYWGAMPPAVLALAIAGPALLFALATRCAGLVYRRLGAIAGIVAFALLWAGFDFLTSFNLAGGAFSTPSAAQVDAPIVVQSASMVGFYGVTFLLGAVSASFAAALRERRPVFALAGLCLFAGNAALGAWRMSEPATDTLRVALVASNDVTGNVRHDNEDEAMRAVNAYIAQLSQLRQSRPSLIVMPENIARIAPTWREQVQAPLADWSRRAEATLVSGFNTEMDGAQRNVSWAFVQGGAPIVYEKRRLVLGLETPLYAPGDSPRVTSNGIGLEICKDLDFPSMIRADLASIRPVLLAAPAWDFGADGWAHARIAIMRSVENGVPMARSARDGYLTLNDRFGRVIARTRVTSGFATLVGAVPLHGRGGDTVYSRIGDVFGWACLALGAILTFAAVAEGRRGAGQGQKVL